MMFVALLMIGFGVLITASVAVAMFVSGAFAAVTTSHTEASAPRDAVSVRGPSPLDMTGSRVLRVACDSSAAI
jgi:hypothetical protein